MSALCKDGRTLKAFIAAFPQTVEVSIDGREREWNGLVPRRRVVAGHGIVGRKRYNAVAGVYRKRKPKTDDRLNLLAAGLWSYFINWPAPAPRHTLLTIPQQVNIDK